MTLKGIALAAALLTASGPSSAAACHHFSRWYYPWRQSCGVVPTTIAKQAARRAPKVGDYVVVAKNSLDMPLPSLARTDLDGGEADEPTRAFFLLRAALEAANAH